MRGGHGAPQGERVMTTYINSKKCAVISSLQRGILGTADGRMAIHPKNFYLFGSSRSSAMPGCYIRFAELKRGALTEEAVRLEAQKNRIYSTWERDRQQELERVRQNLSLQSLYKRPPPAWAHPSIIAEFGDAFLEASGLEGGDFLSSVAVMSLVFERIILHEGHGLFDDFEHDAKQSVNYVAEVMKKSKSLCQKYATAAASGNSSQVMHFIKAFKKDLEALKEVKWVSKLVDFKYFFRIGSRLTI